MRERYGAKSRIPLEGEMFGFWRVQEYVGDSYYRCSCECGIEKLVASAALKNGDSKSCGCKTKTLRAILKEKREKPKFIPKEKFE
jgi:hypothetical protein